LPIRSYQDLGTAVAKKGAECEGWTNFNDAAFYYEEGWTRNNEVMPACANLGTQEMLLN